MSPMLADAALGAGIAFCIAVFTTPVGVSGAVFLVPVQISVLHTPSPAVTPTNLLYNLIAIPGALLRFHREQRLASPLTRLLVLGTLPGVVAGAVIRVELLDHADSFLLVVAAVLVPLGAWLALARPPPAAGPPDRDRRRRSSCWPWGSGRWWHLRDRRRLDPRADPGRPRLLGIRGRAGSPGGDLPHLDRGGPDVCAAQHRRQRDVAPDWTLGIGMGIGGLAGAYLGARLQSAAARAAAPARARPAALALGLRYAVLGLT